VLGVKAASTNQSTSPPKKSGYSEIGIVRIIDEITRNRSGRRGASGDFPELEMNQNSF